MLAIEVMVLDALKSSMMDEVLTAEDGLERFEGFDIIGAAAIIAANATNAVDEAIVVAVGLD